MSVKTGKPVPADPVAAKAPPPTAAAAPGARLRRRARHMLYPLISTVAVIAIIALWQICADTGLVNRVLTSSPSEVFASGKLMYQSGDLLSALGSSAKLYGTGIGISLVVAVPAGIVFGYWRVIGAIFDPLIAMLNATPLIALLPLVLVWFGISFKAQIVMVVIIAIFPILVGTMNGARQLDPDLLRVARSFRASEWAVIRTVLAPSLLPYIVTGLRLSMGLGLVGVVVSEYYLGESGLGGMIQQAGAINNTAGVMVGILLLALAAVLLTALVKWIERRVSPWRA